MRDSVLIPAFGIFVRLAMFYRFDRRTPMSHRHVLRTILKPLSRQWLAHRYRYAEPRVAILRLYHMR